MHLENDPPSLEKRGVIAIPWSFNVMNLLSPSLLIAGMLKPSLLRKEEDGRGRRKNKVPPIFFVVVLRSELLLPHFWTTLISRETAHIVLQLP